MIRRGWAERINLTVIYVILTLVTLAVLYPLVYVVSAAFSPGNTISVKSPWPFSEGVTVAHFSYLFQRTDYVTWFKNTLIVAAATSALTVVVAAMAAYAFSRFRFFLKKSLMISLLILQIFPSFVGMIAIYTILLRIGGLNTLWGLVLVYTAGNVPYNVWLVKTYMDTVPRALDEAARIDGAGHLYAFWRIVLPQTKPILTFLLVTSFTGPWMDFIFPKMVLRSADKQTLALGLFSMVTDRKNEFTTFAAGALLAAVPFAVFFMLTQHLLTTSLSGAAVKE